MYVCITNKRTEIPKEISSGDKKERDDKGHLQWPFSSFKMNDKQRAYKTIEILFSSHHPYEHDYIKDEKICHQCRLRKILVKWLSKKFGLTITFDGASWRTAPR